jgi:hypothetical protein
MTEKNPVQITEMKGTTKKCQKSDQYLLDEKIEVDCK